MGRNGKEKNGMERKGKRMERKRMERIGKETKGRKIRLEDSNGKKWQGKARTGRELKVNKWKG